MFGSGSSFWRSLTTCASTVRVLGNDSYPHTELRIMSRVSGRSGFCKKYVSRLYSAGVNFNYSPRRITTLHYSLQPVNGDHQGVAPQRDFLVMIPAADDTDATATPSFDDLMKMSRKASGTPHPAVLSMAASSNAKFPELKKEGESDWVLHVKIGDLPVAVILVGKVE